MFLSNIYTFAETVRPVPRKRKRVENAESDDDLAHIVNPDAKAAAKASGKLRKASSPQNSAPSKQAPPAAPKNKPSAAVNPAKRQRKTAPPASSPPQPPTVDIPMTPRRGTRTSTSRYRR